MQTEVNTPSIANPAMIESNEKWSFNWDQFWDKAIEYGINLVVAVAILIIGFIIVKRVTKMVEKGLLKREFEPSLQTFLSSMISVVLKILVVLTALSQLGLEMTSFIALIGAIGLAIGMAFSGTLGNFAGGIMILIFKPFRVGDYLGAQGEEGIVSEIHIFNTILLTTDNKTVVIPNGALANGNMTNFTKQKTRRVDFTVGIAYGDSYDKAKEVLTRFMAEDPDIIQDHPGNFIGLQTLADSSVNLKMRAWCNTPDYWNIYFRINEKIYKEFGEEGLNIPFPQMDLHVRNT